MAVQQLGPDLVVEDGPVFSGVVWVGGALCMMREVELSNVEVRGIKTLALYVQPWRPVALLTRRPE